MTVIIISSVYGCFMFATYLSTYSVAKKSNRKLLVELRSGGKMGTTNLHPLPVTSSILLPFPKNGGLFLWGRFLVIDDDCRQMTTSSTIKGIRYVCGWMDAFKMLHCSRRRRNRFLLAIRPRLSASEAAASIRGTSTSDKTTHRNSEKETSRACSYRVSSSCMQTLKCSAAISVWPSGGK